MSERAVNLSFSESDSDTDIDKDEQEEPEGKEEPAFPKAIALKIPALICEVRDRLSLAQKYFYQNDVSKTLISKIFKLAMVEPCFSSF